MKKLLLPLPLLLLMIFCGCQKSEPRRITYEQAENAPPLVLYTSLDDSLTPAAIEALNFKSRILGLKIKYMTGNYASYFEYEADSDQILRLVSQLPFSIQAQRADTLCRRVDYKSLEAMRHKVSATEIENAASFWMANEQDFEVYECNKYPLLHTILIDRKSNKVLHRVACQG